MHTLTMVTNRQQLRFLFRCVCVCVCVDTYNKHTLCTSVCIVIKRNTFISSFFFFYEYSSNHTIDQLILFKELFAKSK